MTQTSAPSSNPSSLSPAARLGWLVLILATVYLCYFHNLGVIGFVGPDEPRYAWIARDMAESGDWVTPRLYGKPWFEKPVLYYWGAALSFKLFGVSESAARLPSAIAALLATLALAWLAWRAYEAEVARWLLLLLPTTVGMIGFSHAAATDMPFAGTLTIAMVIGAVLVGLVPSKHGTERIGSNLPAMVGLGFFLGLAVLAKGPAAIILSGGAVFCWALFTKRWRDAFRCLHPIAIASLCFTALPWYVLCAWRNPDFFRIFIIEHNFQRYLTPEFQHIQPFWFYLPILAIALLPWTVMALWSTVFGVLKLWRTRQASGLTIFLLCWVGFCFLFFSASKSKLPGYLLPAIPAAGLLLVQSYCQRSTPEGKALRWLLLGWAVLGLLAGLLLIDLGRRVHTSYTTGLAMTATGCVILAFALANLLLVTDRSGPIRLPMLCVVPIVFLVLVFRPLAHPWLYWDPSGRTLARELTVNQIPPDQVYVGPMRRGQLYSLSFYLHREIQPWQPGAGPAYLLAQSKSCGAFVMPPFVCGMRPVELPLSGWFVYRVEIAAQ